jgi:hypothetical protein
VNFLRQGVPIVRRPTLEDVADINTFTAKLYGFDDTRQKLAGPADERLALKILIPSRSLADENKISLFVPGTEDKVSPRLAQMTLPAILDLFV